jgi:hypothetical protein
MSDALNAANGMISSVNKTPGPTTSRYFLDQLHDYQILNKAMLQSHFVQFLLTCVESCPMAILGISDAETLRLQSVIQQTVHTANCVTRRKSD